MKVVTKLEMDKDDDLAMRKKVLKLTLRDINAADIELYVQEIITHCRRLAHRAYTLGVKQGKGEIHD